jgi:hypothetical protein
MTSSQSTSESERRRLSSTNDLIDSRLAKALMNLHIALDHAESGGRKALIAGIKTAISDVEKARLECPL